MGIQFNDYRDSGINTADSSRGRSQKTSSDATARVPSGTSSSSAAASRPAPAPVPTPVMSQALSDAGLPDNARNRQIVSSLISQELPIDAETLKSVARSAAAFPNEPLDAVILLKSAGVEVTPSSLADANAFLSARDMLLDALSEINAYIDSADIVSKLLTGGDPADSTAVGSPIDRATGPVVTGEAGNPAANGTAGSVTSSAPLYAGTSPGMQAANNPAEALISGNLANSVGTLTDGTPANSTGTHVPTGTETAAQTQTSDNAGLSSGTLASDNAAVRESVSASDGFRSPADISGSQSTSGVNVSDSSAKPAGASAQNGSFGFSSVSGSNTAAPTPGSGATASTSDSVLSGNPSASVQSRGNIGQNGNFRPGSSVPGATAETAGTAPVSSGLQTSAVNTGSASYSLPLGQDVLAGNQATSSGPDSSAQSPASLTQNMTNAAFDQSAAAAPAEKTSPGSPLSEVPTKELLEALSGKPGIERSDISSEGIKRFLESAVSFLQNAREVSKRSGDEAMAAKVDKAMNSMRTLLKLNDMYAYAEVPVKNEEENKQTHLRFFANKKSRIRKDEGSSAVLHLNMPALKELDVKMVLTGNSLKVDFFSSKDASGYLEADSESLNERLSSIGVEPSLKFEERTAQSTFETSSVSGTEIPVSSQNIKGFDTRA